MSAWGVGNRGWLVCACSSHVLVMRTDIISEPELAFGFLEINCHCVTQADLQASCLSLWGAAITDLVRAGLESLYGVAS